MKSARAMREFICSAVGLLEILSLLALLAAVCLHLIQQLLVIISIAMKYDSEKVLNSVQQHLLSQ